MHIIAILWAGGGWGWGGGFKLHLKKNTKRIRQTSEIQLDFLHCQCIRNLFVRIRTNTVIWYYVSLSRIGGGIAQSVQRLSYGLDGLRMESRCGDISRVSPGQHSDPPPTLYVYRLFFLPGLRWPGCGVDNPPHLAPRLKKVYSYTSTPSMHLHGIFWEETLPLPLPISFSSYRT